MAAKKRLFGTDGVRGVANVDLTAELALNLGKAAAHVLSTPYQQMRVLIARDTRQSGTMLECALAAGLSAMGADVVSLGIAPTPAVAYLAKNGNYELGAVISASHNPATDNGIKFFGSDGQKLPDAIEERIENAIDALELFEPPGGEEVGVIGSPLEPIKDYHKFLLSIIPKPLRGMKIVVDGANGAAYKLAPRILKDLGAEVITIHCEPDGVNINHECGSTHPQSMIQMVKDKKADIGAAFDGDADRVILCDEKGDRVDGDRILALWALHEKAAMRLDPPIVVGTVMSNLGFEKLLNSEGITLVRTPVGDRYVSQAMRERKALIGGEQSGHVIFSQKSTTGDGILTLLETLKVMQESGKPLSYLSHRFEPWPQRLVNLRIKTRDGWDTNHLLSEAVEDAVTELGDEGRINVRTSGTEPLLRVMVEASSIERMEKALSRIVPVVESELGGHVHSITELSDAPRN